MTVAEMIAEYITNATTSNRITPAKLSTLLTALNNEVIDLQRGPIKMGTKHPSQESLTTFLGMRYYRLMDTHKFTPDFAQPSVVFSSVAEYVENNPQKVTFLDGNNTEAQVNVAKVGFLTAYQNYAAQKFDLFAIRPSENIYLNLGDPADGGTNVQGISLGSDNWEDLNGLYIIPMLGKRFVQTSRLLIAERGDTFHNVEITHSGSSYVGTLTAPSSLSPVTSSKFDLFDVQYHFDFAPFLMKGTEGSAITACAVYEFGEQGWNEIKRYQ